MTPTPNRPGRGVPARLAHRPTQGGLVVPWIQVRLADGTYDFRSRHTTKLLACFLRRLCQVDGEPITGPVVLLGGPDRLEPGRYFDEAPVHPECAAYTAAACPMVAGRQPFFADRPTLTDGHRGKRCPNPGCDCGGWVGHVPAGADPPAGPRPAHPWLAVWVESYGLAYGTDGDLLGAVLTGPPLRVRPISDQSGREPAPPP